MKKIITIALGVSPNNQIVNKIKRAINFEQRVIRIEVSLDMYVELCGSREFNCVNFTEPGDYSDEHAGSRRTDIREYFVGFLSDIPVWINNDLEALQFKVLTKAQIRETKICFLLDEEPNHYIYELK